MTIEERNDVCYKAKVCRFCHDPDYVFQKSGRGHDCPVRNKKKSRYTCTDNRCFVHAWICVDHKDNKDAPMRTNWGTISFLLGESAFLSRS